VSLRAWWCKRTQHRLPRMIYADESPYARTISRNGDGSTYGKAWPIPCPRCGALVNPMDIGYPTIMPPAKPLESVLVRPRCGPDEPDAEQ
jgi:hypothetical protein